VEMSTGHASGDRSLGPDLVEVAATEPAALRADEDVEDPHRLAARGTLSHPQVELLGTMPRGQEMPTPDQANQAAQVAVNGKRSRVTVMTAQASGNATSVDPPLGPTRR
jgi:hypothetical protein